ncbi:flavodoxin domain-containing protein [Collinsella intestinalis]|uniref:flavodoxin domain-containing protein n=1 Tax=Collinsella intestinalis TaxID=147207 RepID=UPI00195E8F84|nr:flavodoxin domain-containing protein [Collinsella intestinalis]MBM6908602.1 hypothetical protein [Collinsella intestinalis]
MKAAVVYCSQTGSTKTYADWMAEELSCTPEPLDRIEAVATDAELVVFASWFHAASIKGAKRFQAYMAKHPEKRYAVIAVGATPMPCDLWPASEHEEAFRRSFPADSYPDLPWVYCRGGFHFERLGVMDKIAMRIYFKMLKDEIARGNEREKISLAGMREGFDDCNRSYLEPLLEQLGCGDNRRLS